MSNEKWNTAYRVIIIFNYQFSMNQFSIFNSQFSMNQWHRSATQQACNLLILSISVSSATQFCF